ncbi:DUF423 domain-containing protein [Vibrio sp. V27_P1S3P104]|uniref:DUF423 domain-containing protein n=1 Tax=unclassified Vibrio TaxID=2614977 RepID=UPI001372AB11|nr:MULTISPECIES: DUF423 domain-containing protein [unclassified Vibrio]NAW69391.1 DUF423 domain-containing protein [Vibrio sp. V28_P6S34P95]NAX05490.1 DUF423 domain-containing protein [Vibrio sp. V30_P3S12P165]NAX35165.1 DUF423 domain-containing protein [Vibrio sp. V29_P1S30P107]NAX39017.1 DUF423 domain-containing protein [Vibrio sp. V27_P1S3P104]NAX40383.1 DUF423 domain-containing protein [Vibrio sp. V26_P1S5P106]
MRSQSLLIIGGFFSGVAVALGAFAAHALKAQLSTHLLSVFQTGVNYQFIHGAALLMCGVLLQLPLHDKARKHFSRAAICFIIGILCFSGSLYALALTGAKWFGPITPLGGVLFLFGWGIFILAAMNMKEVKR